MTGPGAQRPQGGAGLGPAGRPVNPRYARAVEGWAMRWRDGEPCWASTRFGFDPGDYRVDAMIDRATAVRFITDHHYTRSVPALRRYLFGLYDVTGRQPELVGVAALSVPARNEVLTGPFPYLAPNEESAELGRLCLLDKVPHGAESWMFGRIRDWLARNTPIRGLVMFSDPETRRRNDGRLLLRGHAGTLYQASNARYLGRGTARWLTVVDGIVFSDRARSKIRALDQGWRYASQTLVDAGADPLDPAREDPAEWLRRALPKAGARRLWHPGCHKYAIPVGLTAGERRSVTITGPSLPYPKLDLRQLELPLFEPDAR